MGAVEGREEGGGKGEEAVLKSNRTEEEDSLPLTGPMYTISEARMKRERRQRKRERRERNGMENNIKWTDLRH